MLTFLLLKLVMFLQKQQIQVIVLVFVRSFFLPFILPTFQYFDISLFSSFILTHQYFSSSMPSLPSYLHSFLPSFLTIFRSSFHPSFIFFLPYFLPNILLFFLPPSFLVSFLLNIPSAIDNPTLAQDAERLMDEWMNGWLMSWMIGRMDE